MGEAGILAGFTMAPLSPEQQARERIDNLLPGNLAIESLDVGCAFNDPTAYTTTEDGIAQNHSIVLEDGTNGLDTYYEWDSCRREVCSETVTDLELKHSRTWEPLCMLVNKVRYKVALYYHLPGEQLVHPTEPNSWAHLRYEPVRSGTVPPGPGVFGKLGKLGVQHWVKEDQLQDHSRKMYPNRLNALFTLNDKHGPAILYALTRYNPRALDDCPWPNEQFDLFG